MKTDAELLALASKIDLTKAPTHVPRWKIADKMLAQLMDCELTEWEEGFVSSVTEWVAGEKNPSEKQWQMIEKLFVKYCGEE